MVGREKDKDVAVLQLDLPKERLELLRPLQLGSSSNLLVGQKVRCAGHAWVTCAHFGHFWVTTYKWARVCGVRRMGDTLVAVTAVS